MDDGWRKVSAARPVPERVRILASNRALWASVRSQLAEIERLNVLNPHAQFGLKFGSTAHEAANQAVDAAPEAETAPAADAEDAETPGEKVISLDSFRKK